MKEGDLALEARASGETCTRCLEPAPRGAARCPQCGQPISPLRRVVSIMAGVAGILALIFLCVVAYRMVYVPEAEQPAIVDPQAAPEGSFAAPPETSSEHETPPPAPADSQPAAAPEAPKKPPLDR
jgi:hypothetical protein